eukprot:gene7936-13827_t
MVYTIIDDQSNSNLAKPVLFDKLAVLGDAPGYRMKTCAGEKFIKGRSTMSLRAKSYDDKVVIKLRYEGHSKSFRECSNILDNYPEIPVPDEVQAYPHLSSITEKMEPVEPDVPIALRIERDVLQGHKAAEEGAAQYGEDAANFMKMNFYVDRLIGTATPEEDIDLLKRSKSMLPESKDIAEDLKDIDLSKDEPPFQRSLGIVSDLKDNTFLVKVPSKEKQFRKRGLLSIVNSIYDPFDFVAPVTLEGRLLVRELTTGTQIGAVRYLRVFYGTVCKTGFVMAKSRVAPKPAHTIPRLCAAVLAVELAETIHKEIDIPLQETMFYTDSKVVYGYINNTL